MHALLPRRVSGALKGQVPGKGAALHVRHVPRGGGCGGDGGGRGRWGAEVGNVTRQMLNKKCEGYDV